MWLWTQTPSPLCVSQPAVVPALPSLSVHGVLGDFGVFTHWPEVPWPGVVLHALSLHSSGVQVGGPMWLWTQTPSPLCVSQPAVVHALPSLSVHGVLGDFGVFTHWPEVPWPGVVLH